MRRAFSLSGLPWGLGHTLCLQNSKHQIQIADAITLRLYRFSYTSRRPSLLEVKDGILPGITPACAC